MKRIAVIFAVSTLVLASAASRAERTVSFESYAVPSSGTIAIAAPLAVPQEGTFAAVDDATNGALRRAVDAVAFQAERNQQLDLPGLAPFDRVVVIGTGADEITPRVLEDVGGLSARQQRKVPRSASTSCGTARSRLRRRTSPSAPCSASTAS